MSNTYVTETLTGATFFDKTTNTTTTLSGTWLAEYDASGNLVGTYNSSFTVTPASGTATTWNVGAGAGTPSASNAEAAMRMQAPNDTHGMITWGG